MKWEFVEKIDLSRRKPTEWEKIYKVKVLSDIYDVDRLWSEYEWAYFYCRADYVSDTEDYELLAELELRAMELNRDVFMGASIGEKEILKEKYIETEWCRRRFNNI